MLSENGVAGRCGDVAVGARVAVADTRTDILARWIPLTAARR